MSLRPYRKRGAPANCGELVSYLRGCRCSLCKKANADYTKETRRKLGKAYVRDCNLRHTYGFDLQEYNNLLSRQNNVCAACKQPETKHNQHGLLPLAVDHDHTTGKTRGLLCMKCNRALGLLNDSPAIIESLLIYRRKY